MPNEASTATGDQLPERRPKPLYYPGDEHWTRWYSSGEAGDILNRTPAAMRGWVRRRRNGAAQFIHDGIEARKSLGKWMFRFDRSWQPRAAS